MSPDEFRAAYGVEIYRNTEAPAAGNPVVAIRGVRRPRPDLPPGTVLDSDDDNQWVPGGRNCWIWCPGCDMAHAPSILGEDGSQPNGPCWEWNGRDDEHFGISPSLLVHDSVHLCGRDVVHVAACGRFGSCHSFIRDGRWEFLPDSAHGLAGKTVPMVPLPDWLVL